MDDFAWDDVRVFLAARDEGSFSRASHRLRVRQSTVSRRVAALEEQLGGEVFLRSAAGLVLTDRGHALVDAAERMAEAARDLSLAAEGVDRGVRGLVRVAMAEGVATWGLLPRMHALFDAHPELRVELVVSAHAADLTRREADLAIRFVPTATGDLVARRLTEFPLGVLVHPDHIDTPWEELPWVVYGDPSVPTVLDGWHAVHTPAPRLRSTSYAATVEAVCQGYGASLLTTALARQIPELVVRSCPVPLPPPLPLWLVAHRATRPLRRVDVVWRALEAMVAEMDAL